MYSVRESKEGAGWKRIQALGYMRDECWKGFNLCQLMAVITVYMQQLQSCTPTTISELKMGTKWGPAYQNQGVLDALRNTQN